MHARKVLTSHGLRQGGWKICLQGSSCTLSFTTKFSWQMGQCASAPSLVKVSSVTEVTGSFATTSLLAGGTLGATGPLSRILIRITESESYYFVLK